MKGTGNGRGTGMGKKCWEREENGKDSKATETRRLFLESILWRDRAFRQILPVFLIVNF